MAIFGGIASLHEARDYLAHPVLGPRLEACTLVKPNRPPTNAPCPPPSRNPRRRRGGVLAPDGGGRGRDARTATGSPPRADRAKDRRAPGQDCEEYR